MVALNSLVLLLAFGAEALAGPLKPASTCSTILGTKVVNNVPTTTATVAKKITIIKKVIRKVNVVVVPVAKTSTIRTTTTSTIVSTANEETDTAWSTVYDSVTRYSTRTTWNTVTDFTTVTTTKDVTSTVPKPAGFTMIKDAGAGYVAKKRSEEERRDDIQNGLAGGDKPQSVRCVKEIPTYSTKTVSTTVQGPRTTLKAATKTKMLTITTITISTEYPPNAKVTSTTTEYPETTSFIDVTSTTRITQSVTVESQIPAATVYEVCSDANIASTANGGGTIYSRIDFITDNTAISLGAGYTPTTCCMACAANPLCMTSWQPGNSAYCYIYLRKTDTASCANGNQPRIGTYISNKNVELLNGGWWLSNGPCGFWANGGVS